MQRQARHNPNRKGLTMKYLITVASLVLMAGTALAAPTACNPATGNWVNAAPTTCPTSDGGGDKWDAHHPRGQGWRGGAGLTSPAPSVFSKRKKPRSGMTGRGKSFNR